MTLGFAPLQPPELPEQARAGIQAGEWTTVRDLLAPLATPEAEEDVVYWHGIASFELGDHAAAAAQLRRALDMRPDDGTARDLARCAAATGDTATLTELAGRFESEGRIAFLAGRAWMRTWVVDPSDVTTDNREGFDSTFGPSDGLLALLTGRTRVESEMWEYMRPGVLEVAEPLLRRAAALEPHVAEHHVWHAAALLALDGREEALDVVLRARSLAPLGWEVHALIAECYGRERPGASANALLAARRVAPRRTTHLQPDIAWLLSLAGRHDEALRVGLDVLRRDPANASARIPAALSAVGAGDYRTALVLLSGAGFSNAATKTVTGQIAYELGRFEEAEKLFRESLSEGGLYQKNELFYNVARALAGQGRIREAMKMLRVVTRKDSAKTRGGEGLYLSGRVAYDLELYAEAAELFRQAIAKDGWQKVAAWHHYLGRSLWGMGERGEALVALDEAMQMEPGNELYARWLFRCYEALDDPHSAIQVCWWVGVRGGKPELALATLRYVREKWPESRTTDRAGERVGSHLGQWVSTAADVHQQLDRHREAALLYAGAFRSDLRSAWSRLVAGDAERARAAFDAKGKSKNRHEATQARLGSAFASIALGDGATAAEVVPSRLRGGLDSETARVWAALLNGDSTARERLDSFTALGLCSCPWGEGVEILYLVPGSPLRTTSPRLRSGDVLLEIGGANPADEDSLDDVRDEPLPAVLRLLVRRAERTFRVDVDLAAFVESLDQGGDR